MDGWQWQVSNKHCGIFHVHWELLMGNTWYYSVPEIVAVNILTTKISSVLCYFLLYTTLLVDAGCQRGISDSGAFPNMKLYKKLETKSLCLPQLVCLNRRQKHDLLFYWRWSFSFKWESHEVNVGQHPKGSKERIFNYRICSVCRVVENVSGLISSVLRMLINLFFSDQKKLNPL